MKKSGAFSSQIAGFVAADAFVLKRKEWAIESGVDYKCINVAIETGRAGLAKV